MTKLMNKANSRTLLISLITTSLFSGCALFEDSPKLSASGKPILQEQTLSKLTKPSGQQPIQVTQHQSQRQQQKQSIVKPQSQVILEASKNYKALLETSQSSEIKAESLLYLADLALLQAEQLLGTENESQMASHLANAARYYQQLLSQYPSTIDINEVQYQLAKVYDLQGNIEQSERILSQLAQRLDNQSTAQPDSAVAQLKVIEANFRLAESAYSKNDYTTAKNFYSKVIEQQNTDLNQSLYFSALFKRAWTHFQQNNFDFSIDDFLDLLVQIKADNSGQAQIKYQAMAKESVRVIALSLSYLEGPVELAKIIKAKPAVDFPAELYLALADLYLSQERYQDTAQTYFTYIDNHPYTENAPDFENKAISVLSRSGFVELVLAAKERFILKYQLSADYWQKTDFEPSTEVKKLLINNLGDVISFHHAEAQAKQQQQQYLIAANWYRIFLDNFPAHKSANDKRWLLAESLTDAGQSLEAIEQYRLLAYGSPSLAIERRDEAAYRIILALQQQYQNLPETSLDLISARLALIDDSLSYIQTFLSAKRRPLVTAQTIELLIKDQDIKRAIWLSRELLTMPTITKAQGYRARVVIADGEFDLGNYPQAEQAYADLLNNYKASKQVTAKDYNRFTEQRSVAIYQQALALKAQQQTEQAIAQLLRLTKLDPNSTVSKTAQFDAGVLMLEAKRYLEAISLFKAFNQRYSKDPLTETIPAKLILAYEATEQWTNAADIYLQIARTETDPEIKRTAHWQAVNHWMKLDDNPAILKTIELWKQYVKQFPAPVDLALEARNHLANLYGKLMANDPSLRSETAWKQAFWWDKIIKTVDNNKLTDARALTLASDALAPLAETALKQYQAVRLTQPLRTSLVKKRKLMQQAIAQYEKLLGYGLEKYSTLSGYQIGEIYHHLGKAIMQSERPKGMSELELEEYELLLEEQVYPFEDKAIAAHQANLSLAKQTGWDQWVAKSHAVLKSLYPARFDKKEAIDDYARNP